MEAASHGQDISSESHAVKLHDQLRKSGWGRTGEEQRDGQYHNEVLLDQKIL